MMPPPLEDQDRTANPSSSSIYDTIHSVKTSLSRQTNQPSQLHLLHSSGQLLYYSDDGTNLSRQQFQSFIGQIRQAVSEFASTSPALNPATALNPNTAPNPITASNLQDSFTTSKAVQRYISLLTETSNHTAALAHAIEAFNWRPSEPAGASTVTAAFKINSLPSELVTGVLSVKQACQPTDDFDHAINTLAHLCDALEAFARKLGMETFSEKAQEMVAPNNDACSSVHSHTLTLGAKILVIDVDLSITRQMARFAPKCRLKISYATDSAHATTNDHPPPSRDPNLALVLERDTQAIADLLFGLTHQSSLVIEQKVIQHFGRLMSNLADLVKLDEMTAQVNQANAASDVDLFDAMQKLCTQIFQVSQTESQDAAASSSLITDRYDLRQKLLDRGHGVASLHGQRPFLDLVFANDPTTEIEYRVALQIKPLQLPTSKGIHSSLPSWSLSDRCSEALGKVASETDPAVHLGSIQRGSGSSVPLHFVAQLDPPVVVSRTTAAKLAEVCGLATTASTAAVGYSAMSQSVDPKTPIWFEDVLSSSWATRPAPPGDKTNHQKLRCSFTLSRTQDSLRDPRSQGLVIDCLPFVALTTESSLAATATAELMDESESGPITSSRIGIESCTVARFFKAIEILRDEVKVTELVHSAVTHGNVPGVDLSVTPSSTKDVNKDNDIGLDDLLSSGNNDNNNGVQTNNHTIPVLMSLRYPTLAPSQTGDDAEVLVLDLGFTVPSQGDHHEAIFKATLTPCSTTTWRVEANVVHDGSCLSFSLDSNSNEAIQIAQQLNYSSKINGTTTTTKQGLEILDQLVISLIEWSQSVFPSNVRLIIPQLDHEFDPLAYEEKNVHEVYESIAPHFSSTRYKPWPLIPLFLSTIPEGSIGADLGCGNGKYLSIRSTLCCCSSSLVTIGIDRSSNLIHLARDNTPSSTKHEVTIADALETHFRTGLFDYAISIATIHHFSTWKRRKQAVSELIRLVAPVSPSPSPSPSSSSTQPKEEANDRLKGSNGRGRFMIFAWALEQGSENKRQFNSPLPLQQQQPIDQQQERKVQTTGITNDQQDVLVPWVFSSGKKKKEEKEEKVYQRYYHVFQQGELEKLVQETAKEIPDSMHGYPIQVVCQASGWERGNWWGVWRVEKESR